MLAPAVGVARQQPFEQHVLGAEMPVDEAVGDPGLLRDRAQRHLGRTGRSEEPLGGIEHGVGDLVSAGRAARLGWR